MHASVTELNQANCIEAKNGQDAAKIYKKVKPDFVLMDFEMPIKNGMSATSGIQKQAIKSSAVYFLEKPFDISNFLKNIKHLKN
jgi:YesN/AraC family two-component response regulator